MSTRYFNILILIVLVGNTCIADGWGSTARGVDSSRVSQMRESQARINSTKTTCSKYINIRNNSQYKRFLKNDEDIDIVDLDKCRTINIVVSIENVRDYDVNEGFNVFSSHLNLNGKLKHKKIYSSLNIKNCKFKGDVQTSLNITSSSGSIQNSSIISNSNIQSSRLTNTSNRTHTKRNNQHRSSSVSVRNSQMSARVSGRNNYIKHGTLGNRVDTNGQNINIDNSTLNSSTRTNNSRIDGANTGNHIRLNRSKRGG